MLGKLHRITQKHCPMLLRESMPVWLTIVLSLAAAGGAYWVAPIVNRRFEVDRARGEHISRTTENLNSEIIELSQKIRRFNETIVNGGEGAAELRGACLDHITKLQWMLVDLNIALTSEDDRKSVSRLSAAIRVVKSALDQPIGPKSQTTLLSAMQNLGAVTEDVLNRLYVKAALKPKK